MVVWPVVAAVACVALAQQPTAPVPAKDASAAALLERGQALEARNDLAGAAEAYRQAVDLAPKNARARDKLGFVLGRQGRTEEALEAFASAVKIDPTLFDAHYHLGATRWWTKDLKGALEPLRVAVRLRPKHPEARYYLGLTLKQLGDLDAAIEHLRIAARLGPSLAVTHLQLGVALQSTGRSRRSATASSSGRGDRSRLCGKPEQSRPGLDAKR